MEELGNLFDILRKKKKIVVKIIVNRVSILKVDRLESKGSREKMGISRVKLAVFPWEGSKGRVKEYGRRKEGWKYRRHYPLIKYITENLSRPVN